MKTLTATEAHTLPLTTDADIEDRTLTLVGAAIRRQLWLMFLTADDVQLPVLMPVDDLPELPDRVETDVLVSHLAGLLDQIGAAQLVLVWERPGRGLLNPSEAAWARALALDCERRGIRLRAQLLSHTRGVMLLTPADYAAPPPLPTARLRPTGASNTAGTEC